MQGQGGFDQQGVVVVEEEGLVELGLVWEWIVGLVKDAFFGGFVSMEEGNEDSFLQCVLVPRSDKLRTSSLGTQ